MDLQRIIKTIDGKPLSHQVIMSFFKDYKNPNDKIHQLTKQNVLISLRKGLYVFNSDVIDKMPSSILLANQIYGPSYISLDFALQYYNAIPERVFTITSITIKRSKEYVNKLGTFTYAHVPMAYYQLGIVNVSLPNKLFGLMATPEKALIDKVITSYGINIRSISGAQELLFEDWRISEEWAASLNIDLMIDWLEKTPKKTSIENIIKALTV